MASEKHFLILVTKVIGLPIQVAASLVILIYAFFGVSALTLSIGQTQVSLVPISALFIFGNSLFGAIFRRSIIPIPEPDLVCNKCKSRDVEIMKSNLEISCKQCKSIYTLKQKVNPQGS